MSVYRNSAGTRAVNNKNKTKTRFATKTTTANPSNNNPLISRHSMGTNVQHNMNQTNLNISEIKKQCMTYSYYQCNQSNTCTWTWKEENKSGYCV